MRQIKPVGTLATLFAVGTVAATLPAVAEQKMESVNLTDIRGMKFCEFLLISDKDVVIYNTSASNGCPEDTWKALDTASIAAAHGVGKVQLNGPHFWIMDEQTIGLGDTGTFGGIEARYAATLPLSALGSGTGSTPYAPYTSAKDQTMVFRAGQPVYQLIGPDGSTYILNAYGAEVQDGDPANLATQLSPAEGWAFQVQIPAEDLTIRGSSETPVHMVGDDLHQYYTRLE
ncbi:hypothetical protein CLV78_101354 [Aliiruegeria haliotis]|uniref:Uncharacterized protein n=1 Tax=Aliiruegeria haliotis TaxID=1280846 RepID=A0A2T0RYK1_9RHOB|nr:hypothetical protein [Aliiruegeria haliotis]PRY26259.1 hypothetical protein CLV78_101354 [Aliiruegeria haliotis]